MTQFVKNYVKGCPDCQQFKLKRTPTKPFMAPIRGTESDRPFANISANFITGLPLSDNYDTILSIVDHSLTKGVIHIPCNKTFLALDTAQALLDNIYK